MQKKKKSTSLLVVLRSPGSIAWHTNCRAAYMADHIIHLAPCDLQKRQFPPDDRELHFGCTVLPTTTLQKIALANSRAESIDQLSIVGDHATTTQLRAILEEVLPLLTTDATILVVGFKVGASEFDAMVSSGTTVEFENCQLLTNWWKPSGRERRCNHIRFSYCSGAVPRKTRIGGASWTSLRSLVLWEHDQPAPFGPVERLGRSTSQYPIDTALTEALVCSLWNSSFAHICLDGCRSLDFLRALPIASTMESLAFWHSPTTPEVLDWIVAHRRVSFLALAWERSVQLPWAKLKQMKRLRGLDVTDTYLDDNQLVDIARHVPLRSVMLYYTAVTAKSWTTLLNWPSLRTCWGSQELMGGEFPVALPSETNLKEFVALNARTPEFTKLLSRYSGVAVAEM